MKTKQWVLPGIGAAFFTFSVVHIVGAQKTRAYPAPLTEPTTATGDRIAGTGVIEPSSENISAGTHRSGVVDKVLVHAGDVVKQRDPLFCLDNRAQTAELHGREADLSMARSQLDRLTRMPRAEELPPLMARVGEAKAKLEDADDNLQRTRSVVQADALPEEQGVRALQQREVAANELREAQADLDLKRAGAWTPDLRVAAAAVRQAEANVERAQTELDLLCPTALVDSTVLRVDVRVGEFVNAGPSSSLVTLGVMDPLNVRVDVDEVDIPRFRPDAPARAYIRGKAETPMPLHFVRVEPAVQPKASLSGANTERVDTRVLQALYRFDPVPPGTYVGQQVDIVIDASAASAIAFRSLK
jgi:multidrug efflux pump subunit AcrA (membrane-fusion protein)